MQVPIEHGIRQKIVVLVGQIRRLGRMGRSPHSNYIDNRRSSIPVLRNSVDFLASSNELADTIHASNENPERQLESRFNHLSAAVLSSDSRVLGENGRSGGDQSPSQTERSRSDQERRGIEHLPFLHLAIRFEDSEAPKRDRIEEVLNRAKDWYRYANNCWIIYTTRSADTWYKRISEIPGMKNHTSFFIAELNLGNRAGWLSSRVWKWLDKER